MHHSRRYFVQQSKELKIELSTSSESALTAFRTLYMRYSDTLNASPILNDKYSAQYVQSFEYSPSDLPPSHLSISSVLEPYRAKIIDMNLLQWIRCRHSNHLLNIETKTANRPQICDSEQQNVHKSVLHIIEIGIGFDTRFERIFLSQSNATKQNEQMTDFEHPSIACLDNTISWSNDFDIVYFYELDFCEIIKMKQLLIEEHKINDLMRECNANSNNKRVHRSFYEFDVNDIRWFDSLKNEIIKNHKAETGKTLSSNFKNVAILSESLFLFLKHNELKQLIHGCCNALNGATLICDESMTNDGLMNIEKKILSKNPLSYDIKNKVFPLKLDEVNQRLSFLIRWTVGYLTKNHYKILVIQFRKPITNRMEMKQL